MKVEKCFNAVLSIAIIITLCCCLTVSAFAFSGIDCDEEITCTKLTEPYEVLDVASQGGSNYGRYYIQTITGGAYFYLYDIETNEFLAKIPLNGDGSAYKNNNANFSSEFYCSTDELPLLYVSSAYDYEINVFRFYQENGVWKVMTVQTISYPSINNEAGFFSCNAVLDNANGFLYLTPLSNIYTNLDNTQHFYKFDMPSLQDGNIELTLSDALWHCSVNDYIHAPQGEIIMGNKVYQLYGVGNAFLRVFDLSEERYIKTYKLADFGYNMEPESIGFYNGDFYSMDDSLEVWRISIESAEIQDEIFGTEKENHLTEWELGSVNPTTGGESSSTKIARMSEAALTLGADRLIIETPPHYLDGTRPGSYYKWRVIWFNGSTCLGLAEEQCDFTTFTSFAVPDNADSYRIAIAAVYRGKTQNSFPLSRFLNNGGLTTYLFTENTFVQSQNNLIENINDWEIGSFNADGTENTKTRIARMPECRSTCGADELIIDAPVYYSGLSTNDTFYKWSVQWYSGNTCLGLASEQSNFDTVTHYSIPANADSYRIKIAAVSNGVTVDPFPMSRFISHGGLTLSLCGVSQSISSLSDFEIGSMNPITGIENSLTRIIRSDDLIQIGAASRLYVAPPTHYTGSTTSENYYKWRIVWFDGTTCLGIAPEQTTFSDDTEFVVPEGADRFSINIASVVNGETEDPFPISTFVNAGGIKVHFIYS